MAVRLEPLWCDRRVTAPQVPLRTAAALLIQVSTVTCNTAVSLHDPSLLGLGSLIRRLTCFRAVALSTSIPQKNSYPETIPHCRGPGRTPAVPAKAKNSG